MSVSALLPTWIDDAACLEADVNEFFPNTNTEESPKARAICAACPVRTDCLEHALELGVPYGIWGGHTSPERRELRALRRSATTEKKEQIMEDIHGEPVGDERVTYAKPPTLKPVGAPLPPQAAAAARLLARTEAHPDPVIRSARKIAAQALTHLDDLVRQHEAMGRSVDRALVAVRAQATKFPNAGGATSPKAVRQWAADNGIECPQFGRVPKHVVDQYLAQEGSQS